MPTYTLHWELVVKARDSVMAALEGREIQLDPSNLATVFTVEDEAGNVREIDVLDHEEGDTDMSAT